MSLASFKCVKDGGGTPGGDCVPDHTGHCPVIIDESRVTTNARTGSIIALKKTQCSSCQSYNDIIVIRVTFIHGYIHYNSIQARDSKRKDAIFVDDFLSQYLILLFHYISKGKVILLVHYTSLKNVVKGALQNLSTPPVSAQKWLQTVQVLTQDK